MRVAILSDIHSNIEALNAALVAMDHGGVAEILCLGDIVGYGPFPNECIDLIRTRCQTVVKGNHDSGVLGETPLSHFNEYGREAIEWTKKQVTQENLRYLKSLPLLNVRGDATLVHASPWKPEQWNYVTIWTEAKKNFKAFKTTLCLIGHTHVPMVIGEDFGINTFSKGKRFLINVGSVGQPRDGNPQASFGLLDTEAWTFDINRVTYDIEKTARAIKDAGLPSFLADRLFIGV